MGIVCAGIILAAWLVPGRPGRALWGAAGWNFPPRKADEEC